MKKWAQKNKGQLRNIQIKTGWMTAQKNCTSQKS